MYCRIGNDGGRENDSNLQCAEAGWRDAETGAGLQTPVELVTFFVALEHPESQQE